MSDAATDSTHPISRRPLTYWAAMAVLWSLVTSAAALYVATCLADLM